MTQQAREVGGPDSVLQTRKPPICHVRDQHCDSTNCARNSNKKYSYLHENPLDAQLSDEAERIVRQAARDRHGELDAAFQLLRHAEGRAASPARSARRVTGTVTAK